MQEIIPLEAAINSGLVKDMGYVNMLVNGGNIIQRIKLDLTSNPQTFNLITTNNDSLFYTSQYISDYSYNIHYDYIKYKYPS